LKQLSQKYKIGVRTVQRKLSSVGSVRIIQIHKRCAAACQQNRYGVEHQVGDWLESAFCKRRCSVLYRCDVVCDKFLEEKTKELREDSMRSYCSFVGTFTAVWFASFRIVKKLFPFIFAVLILFSCEISTAAFLFLDNN
ncbi:MAG: hypothetical protein FWH36_09540, partial [Lentimicrobiaceae bacterium]|nr:hypothetical protein [Lentimicrobiaceae bacterium]